MRISFEVLDARMNNDSISYSYDDLPKVFHRLGKAILQKMVTGC